MTNKVFYSWQLDTPANSNCDLIRDALQEAMRKLPWNLELDESARGIPGSPVLFKAISDKIDSCAVFVADLTICGKYTNKKSTPNPNVLVEYGYALKVLGENGILTILNRHFGDPENLPFDLRVREVNAVFELAAESSEEQRRDALANLSSSFEIDLDTTMKKSLFLGLGPKGAEAVRVFVEESKVGSSDDPPINFADFCGKLQIDEPAALSIVDDLDAHGLIERIGAAGDPLIAVRVTNKVFWQFDRLYKPWVVQEDAALIAEKLVSGEDRNENQLVSQSLCEELIWKPRRLNPALSYLVKKGIVRASSSAPYPFLYYSIYETLETRRFVRSLKRQEPD